MEMSFCERYQPSVLAGKKEWHKPSRCTHEMRISTSLRILGVLPIPRGIRPPRYDSWVLTGLDGTEAKLHDEAFRRCIRGCCKPLWTGDASISYRFSSKRRGSSGSRSSSTKGKEDGQSLARSTRTGAHKGTPFCRCCPHLSEVSLPLEQKAIC